jgi:hypothetical protein
LTAFNIPTGKVIGNIVVLVPRMLMASLLTSTFLLPEVGG